MLYFVAAVKLYRILFRADAHRSSDHNMKMRTVSPSRTVTRYINGPIKFIQRVIALLIAIFLNVLGAIFLLTMGSDPTLFTWFVYPIGRGVFVMIAMYIATSFFQVAYVPPSSKSKAKASGSGSGDGSKKGSTALGDSTNGDGSYDMSLK